MKLEIRSERYFDQYRQYCREFWEADVRYFRPTNPERLDDGWFLRTKAWYDEKMRGERYPHSLYYDAVEDGQFIGEFQLRLVMDENIMNGIGSVGYSVRICHQGRGYGREILRQGLDIARENGLNRVLLNINDANVPSIKVCEAMGGVLQDIILTENAYEGRHLMRRYWIEI